MITLSTLELSRLLEEALNYLNQSGKVGGCWQNHRHAIGVHENSLRRQHASSEGTVPSADQHINGERGEEGKKKSIDPTCSGLWS